MSYFSEPIVTSRGIIVGSTPDGRPHFAGDFFSITQFPNSYSNSYYNNGCNNQQSNSSKYVSIATTYNAIADRQAEIRAKCQNK